MRTCMLALLILSSSPLFPQAKDDVTRRLRDSIPQSIPFSGIEKITAHQYYISHSIIDLDNDRVSELALLMKDEYFRPAEIAVYKPEREKWILQDYSLIDEIVYSPAEYARYSQFDLPFPKDNSRLLVYTFDRKRGATIILPSFQVSTSSTR